MVLRSQSSPRSAELRRAARSAGDSRAKRRGRRRRPIRADDLLKLRGVATPRPSPDGRHVVYVVKTVGAKNAFDQDLWLADVEAGTTRQLTRGARDAAPVWSPDGTRVAFLSGRTPGHPQIAVIPVDGGEARTLTGFPEGSLRALKWSPDGRRLGVLFRPQDPDWTEAARAAREASGEHDPPRVLDDPVYRLDGDGYFNGQRFALHVVDAESGERRCVYDQDRTYGPDYDFSPDGKRVALVTDRDRMAFAKGWLRELAVLDVASGKLRTLPGIPAGHKLAVCWSPDGRHLAFACCEDDDGSRMADNYDLWVCDASRGRARNLTRRSDRCLVAPTLSDTAEVEFAAQIRWAPDGRRLWVQIGWHGETQLASVALRGGALAYHTSGRQQHWLGDLSADGRRVTMVIETGTRPGEVYVADVPRARAGQAPGELEPRRVTDVNGALLAEVEVARPTARWVTSADGTRVQVWSLFPPRAARTRKLPAVLQIHGGPQAQYGWSFFHEFQLLAAEGHAVFFSNPRGSKGYGRDFCAATLRDWGGKDWEDVQAVQAHMDAHPRVDAGRMGIMGGSFGGYMTLWAIGHTHGFRAAIADRCVSDMVSMWGSSDIFLWPDTYFPGNTWSDPQALWDMSPLKHLGSARTPTLLIHSEGDLRCNVAESEQAHAVLSLRGVPTRFVRYPRTTSHGMSRAGPPDMRLHRLAQITDWWARWLKGKRGRRS